MAKQKTDNDKVINIKIKESTVKRIDAYAKKMKINNRSQLCRNLITAGLDDLDLMNTTGLLAMAIKGVDLLGIIKEALNNKKFKVENDNRLIIDL